MNRLSSIIMALMVPFVLFAACGRKGAEMPPDTIPPQVVATAPSVNNTDVSPDTAISVTFSEAINQSTIAFSLIGGNGMVSCSMRYSGTTAVLTPVTPLKYNTLYTATIRAGVKDLLGNQMANDYEWNFMTGASPDATPPRVIDIQPSKRKTYVSPSTIIAILFSEPVDPSTISPATIKVSTVTGDVPGTLAYNGTLAAVTFTPDHGLSASKDHFVTVTTGVKDLAKNAMTDAFVSSFKTGTANDATPPSVLPASVLPASGAATAAVNTPVSVTFSEPMDVSTITPSHFIVQQGNTAVSGTLQYYGTTVVFTPSDPLKPSTSYRAILSGPVTDLAGNSIPDDYTWSFTTELQAPDIVQPSVRMTLPGTAQNVPVYKQAAALFSETMLAHSITPATFTLVDRNGSSVPGQVTTSGAMTVFTPAQPLEYSATYIATLTPDVTDLAGNPLGGNGATWSFTTEAVATFTITATAGASGSISPSGAVTVDQGADQTFTISPKPGYHVADVLVDGSSVGAVTTYTFSDVSDDHTITAHFAINTYAITAAAEPNGSISPSGAVTVDHGANQTFTISPDPGYHVAVVLADGVVIGAVTTYTFTSVATDHTITARFAINAYSVTPLVSGGNGSITPATAQTVSHSGTTSFTLTPAAEYSIVTPVGGTCGGTLAGNIYTTNPVTAHCTVIASFAINTFTITATAGANGTITPSGAVTVNHGANQAFTITPAAGYHVSDVLVDGASVGAVTSYPFTNVTAAHTISASFAIDTHTITATADANGTITPSGTVTVNHGANQTFTFTPNTGYYVSAVTVDGVPQGLAGSYTFTNVTADHTIAVSFLNNMYQITAIATPTGGGTITPGTVLVPYGGNQSFTILANTGYHILDVQVDSVSAGAVTSYLFTNVTTHHTISASFAINTFTVTPSVTGGNGSVSPDTPQTVDHNATTSFILTPAAGYHIDSVSGTCGGTLAENTYTTNAVIGNCTVVASFAIDTYTITATAGPNGSVTPAGPVTVDHGADLTFTVIPAGNYHVADVLVDGSSVGAVTSYTFMNVTAGHTITASFAIDTYTITATAGPNGSVSPDTPQTVDYDGTTTFTVTPDSGYHIASVTGCGGTLAGSSYTTGPITASCVVTATFTINTYTVTPSAGTGGSIAPSGPQTVPHGSTTSFTLTPDTGYHIDSVGGTCGGSLTDAQFTTNAITNDCTVEAGFAPDIP